MPTNIIKKLQKNYLIGHGGGCFDTAYKWEMVKKAKGDKKYIICNGSEGEPGVHKDEFLLKNKPEEVIDGIKLAIEYLSADRAFLYLNPNFYKKFSKKLKVIIGNSPIELFKKDHKAGYVAGEETTAINHIEGKLIEPRLRPPFPTTCGLWGQPTLINNVETFYDVSLIHSNSYEQKRFYSINGDCIHTGVYEFPENWTIEKILKETDNYPDFDFFVQVGGDASGEVLNSKQLKKAVPGCASITVYSTNKHEPIDLFRQWINFFTNESCGQCTPCREGTYRLQEIVNSEKPDWQTFHQLLNTLEQTSFCGLGMVVPIATRSYIKNILKNKKKINIKGDIKSLLKL